MVLKFQLIVFCFVNALNLANATNYLRPDIFTYNTEEPNWRRPPHDRIVLCGMVDWRHFNDESELDNFNASMCTHLVYRFAHFNNKGKLHNVQGDFDDTIPFIMKFKKKFTHLRVFVELRFDIMDHNAIFNDRKSRLSTVDTSINFMKKYKFDGISLLIVMPLSIANANPIGQRDNLYDFIKLYQANPDVKKTVCYNSNVRIQEIKAAFLMTPKMLCNRLWQKEHALGLRVINYKRQVLRAYQFRRIIEYVDYFAMSMQDMEGKFKTWFPLHCISSVDNFCVDYQIRVLIALGIPMNRVVISLPMGGIKMWVTYETKVRPGHTSLRETSEYHSLPSVCHEIYRDQHYTYSHHFHGEGHVWYSHRWGYNSYHHQHYATVMAYETARTLIHKVRFVIPFGVRGFFLPQANWDDIKAKCHRSFNSNEYADIKFEFDDIKRNVDLPKAIPNLNFPNETTLKAQRREWLQMYVKNGKLELSIPNRPDIKQNLLRGITNGIVYAQQEQAIHKALRRRKAAQGTRMLWRDEVWQMFPEDY